MSVTDLISILQRQKPAAIVVLSDRHFGKAPGISKLGVGEAPPTFVIGAEDMGLMWLSLADATMPDAAPALLLGEAT